MWFIVCLGYILILALRQAGIDWWVIFSLSGHSILIILLLISLYLYVIFKGISRTLIAVEHPLTSTSGYLLLYDASPFLGAAAGCIGMAGTYEYEASQFLLGIVLGTLGATFLSWIIIDPTAGLLETLLPASRKHRIDRLAKAKELRQEMQRSREQLLAKVLLEEESNQLLWQKALMPEAERLAEILTNNKIDFQTECEVAKIGVKTWQIGGLSCMRYLHDMTMAICKKKNRNTVTVDYISIWWDGIGSWQSLSPSEMIY